MYARRVKDRTLTFYVSGLLWHRSLVMQDLETKTLWSHLLGRGMRGPLKDEKLEVIPSVMTDWESWRSRHPDTTVVTLPRTSARYRREFYRKPSRFVLGITVGGLARAWPFDQLLKQPVVNDQFAGEPVLVLFEPIGSTALAFRRTVDGRELHFEKRGDLLFDRETGSSWDPLTGQAITAGSQAMQLTPLPAVVSYRRAWLTFHPETQFWQAPSSDVPATPDARDVDALKKSSSKP